MYHKVVEKRQLMSYSHLVRMHACTRMHACARLDVSRRGSSLREATHRSSSLVGSASKLGSPIFASTQFTLRSSVSRFSSSARRAAAALKPIETSTAILPSLGSGICIGGATAAAAAAAAASGSGSCHRRPTWRTSCCRRSLVPLRPSSACAAFSG